MSTSKFAGLVVCAAVFASPAYAAPVPADHACMGPWIGQASNPDHTMFGITLTMTESPDGGRCGSIEYTNPSCGGTLESCTLVGADIHTRELYTHGQSDCAPAGRVIIRCEGTTMRYQWRGQYSATTVLHRPPNWRPMPPPPPPPRIVPPVQQQQPPPPPPQVQQVQPAPREDDDGVLAGCSASRGESSPSALFFVALALFTVITLRATAAARTR